LGDVFRQAEEDCVKALYRSGLAYLHLGEYKQSVENLLKAHDLSPDDKTITKDLARAITMQKKSEVSGQAQKQPRRHHKRRIPCHRWQLLLFPAAPSEIVFLLLSFCWGWLDGSPCLLGGIPYLFDGIHTMLDVIPYLFDGIHTMLDVIPYLFDGIHTMLDVIPYLAG
jgi:hypothetical protein